VEAVRAARLGAAPFAVHYIDIDRFKPINDRFGYAVGDKLLCAAARDGAPLQVFGTDFPTKDGTAVRDYVHVMDVAEGHLAALSWLEQQRAGEFVVLNLGTGKGTSVYEVLCEMAAACGREVRFERCARRPGDAPEYTAVVWKAQSLLGWSASRTLRDICSDAWRHSDK